MNDIDKGRILYADLLRIITIFGIIVFHVSTARWMTSFYESKTEWHVLNFFVTTLRWCVPVFFMLSGMMFLNPKYDLTFKKLFKKSIPRILVALIFWSLVYRILSPLTAYVLNIRQITNEDFERIYSELFFGTAWHHLWFLYVLIGLYLLSPLLRVFTANAKRELYLYFLSLFVIFGSIIPFLENWFGVKFSFGIYELNSYIGYFIAGYFFANFDLSKIERKIIYGTGIFSMVVMLAITINESYKFNIPSTFLFDRINPFVMLSSFAIFALAKNIFSNIEKIKWLKNDRYITQLANYGFGVYLVHEIFNILFGLLNITTNTFPAILSVPILSIIIYVCSLLATVIISKIPILKKWII